jgi:hypothetical protein
MGVKSTRLGRPFSLCARLALFGRHRFSQLEDRTATFADSSGHAICPRMTC